MLLQILLTLAIIMASYLLLCYFLSSVYIQGKHFYDDDKLLGKFINASGFVGGILLLLVFIGYVAILIFEGIQWIWS